MILTALHSPFDYGAGERDASFVAACRGQATTFEAVIACVVIIGAVVVVMGGVVPGGSDAGVSVPGESAAESSLSSSVSGVVSAADRDSSLRTAVLAWDSDQGTFVNASSSGYASPGAVPGEFGDRLTTGTPADVTVNVRVTFADGDGESQSEWLLYQGEPGSDAVTVTRPVVLAGSDTVPVGPDAGEEIRDVPGFYVPDTSTVDESGVYNTVHVEVTAWRVGE